jgi:hypothetical protein
MHGKCIEKRRITIRFLFCYNGIGRSFNLPAETFVRSQQATITSEWSKEETICVFNQYLEI